MESGKKPINLYLDRTLLARIDKFRFEKHFVSRTEAIRHLLNTALQAVEKPAKKST